MTTPIIELDTERMRLRQWQPADREPFAAMSTDPAVMAYFPALQDRAVSDRNIDRWQAQIAEVGFGFWAVELVRSGQFIGFVGLNIPRADLPFSPCVEIAWRLARPFWGRGLASEAALAVLKTGFERLEMPEIVAFTALENHRSRAVMARIGLQDTGQDFEHPGLPVGHRLRPHCLYRISRSQWTGRTG